MFKILLYNARQTHQFYLQGQVTVYCFETPVVSLSSFLVFTHGHQFIISNKLVSNFLHPGGLPPLTVGHIQKTC